MRLGIIGCGTVGGALKKYFEEKTDHELVFRDPAKGLNDSFDGVDAVFVSVPVPPANDGQDLRALREAVSFAQEYTRKVFVRSTVLPGTNDLLSTISCPEFLTERRAFEDMCALPILVGLTRVAFIKDIFPDKEFIMVSNVEAELAKFAHNCFGAMKVTYFNMISEIASRIDADYENVLRAARVTGFINLEHTKVPGPDCNYGYSGKCFPENIAAFKNYTKGKLEITDFSDFFRSIERLNDIFRSKLVLNTTKGTINGRKSQAIL